MHSVLNYFPLDLILISSGYGGVDDSAMRWCAAADVANLIRAPTSPPLLLHLEVLVCGILVAVDLHVRHVTLLGGDWGTDSLRRDGRGRL